MRNTKVMLIAGPTASGKSALALDLARALDGIIINADSMQVYRDLRVITARPTPEEERLAPHRLYGHVDAAETYSAGRWLADAVCALNEAREARRVPIVVGGTGLYFRILLRGLASIPSIPAEIRDRVRARLTAEGAPALHAELATRDPAGACRVQPTDRSRVARALEVVEATGRSISDWHKDGFPPALSPADAAAVFILPPREELLRRIDARFDAMLAQGALAEVRALAARGLAPLLPAMKAHGVPWLVRHLAGEVPYEDSVAQAKLDTRRYAKRQMTWFRNQLPEFVWMPPEAASSNLRGQFA